MIKKRRSHSFINLWNVDGGIWVPFPNIYLGAANIFAVPRHEASHAWVAWKLGDNTAYELGRVTFNPMKHIDLFGTIILPGMVLIASGGVATFGYAKPVPINFWKLNIGKEIRFLSLWLVRYQI